MIAMRLLCLCLSLFLLSACAGPLVRTSRPEKIILKEPVTYTWPADAQTPLYRYTLPAGTYSFFVKDGGTWIYLNDTGALVKRESYKKNEHKVRERPAGLELFRSYDQLMAVSVSPGSDFSEDGLPPLAWWTAKKHGQDGIMVLWGAIPKELASTFVFEGSAPLD